MVRQATVLNVPRPRHVNTTLLGARTHYIFCSHDKAKLRSFTSLLVSFRSSFFQTSPLRPQTTFFFPLRATLLITSFTHENFIHKCYQHSTRKFRGYCSTWSLLSTHPPAVRVYQVRFGPTSQAKAKLPFFSDSTGLLPRKVILSKVSTHSVILRRGTACFYAFTAP